MADQYPHKVAEPSSQIKHRAYKCRVSKIFLDTKTLLVDGVSSARKS